MFLSVFDHHTIINGVIIEETVIGIRNNVLPKNYQTPSRFLWTVDFLRKIAA
jgi:hypothetical protein